MPSGTTTALVGPTGSGKSTIANLLLRYYDVESGKVSIGGINVKNFTLSELRKNIGLVSQDPFLFDSTVKENLLLAAPLSTEVEITEALKIAQAWDFVSRLPLGFKYINRRKRGTPKHG